MFLHPLFLQLFTALKKALSVILKFLNHLSTVILKAEPKKLDDLNLKHFVGAMARVIGAWLSEDTVTMREEVTLLIWVVLVTLTFFASHANELALRNTEQRFIIWTGLYEICKLLSPSVKRVLPKGSLVENFASR
jgi:hypothetical protein